MVKKRSYNKGKIQTTIYFKYEISDFNYLEIACKYDHKLKDSGWAITKENCEDFNKSKKNLNHFNYERLKDFNEIRKSKNHYITIEFTDTSEVITFFSRRFEIRKYLSTQGSNLFIQIMLYLSILKI